jgi:pilus assembly protein TadC
MVIDNLVKVIGRMIPKGIKKSTEISLNFAGIEEDAEIWLSKKILTCISISLVLSLIVTYFMNFYFYFDLTKSAIVFVLIFLLAAAIIGLIFYFEIYYKIDDRRKKCQKILPEFLSLIATNINAGVEPISALYMSLRPDFSPITEELNKLKSLSMSSRSILEQLSYLEKRIDSRSLKMALRMIEKGAASGGKLSILLENVAMDLREANEIENELKTATRGYIYFILFLIIIGVPLLLAASSIFVKTIFSSKGFGGGPPFLLFIATEREATVEQLNVDLLFTAFLVIGAIASSLMLGVVWGGEMKNGVKYIPLITIVSYVFFFLFSSMIQRILSFLGVF